MAAQRARSALWVLPYPRSVVVPRAMSASLVWAWHLLSVRGMSLGQLGTAQTFDAAMPSPRSLCRALCTHHASWSIGSSSSCLSALHRLCAVFRL